MSVPEATIGQGRLRGAWDGPAAVFRGVPYAAPPTGPSRFAPPRPHEGWAGTRDATEPGPAAPQGRSALEAVLGRDEHVQSEGGCLTLNVFTPQARRTGLPVLVWFHGGAFATGRSSGARQSAARLATRGELVVITVNYRLGPLGYLFLGGGNFGLLDQIAALRWAQDNVAAFGGDPGSITVGGHSAGALSAAAAAVSPLAEGLARRVLLLSPEFGALTTPEAATRETQAQLDRLGLGMDDLGELRERPPGHFVKAAAELAAQRGPGPVPPSLVVGGAGLPRDVATALREAGDLDVLVGTVRDEARAFLVSNPAAATMTRPPVLKLLRGWLGEDATRAYDHYAARRPGAGPAEVMADALTDKMFRVPILRLCEDRARAGDPAYLHQFDWTPPTGGFGACHGVDLPFLLGDLTAWRSAPVLEGVAPGPVQALSDTFIDALAAFVRTGRPPWHAYTQEQRTTMRFDSVIGPLNDAEAAERRLWSGWESP